MFERKDYEKCSGGTGRPDRTALLVRGARQIGKSTLVRHLGETCYDVFVEVNLYSDPAAKEALANARNTEELLSRISLMASSPLEPGRTLIFIDEIQELPDIITMAKFLVEDGGSTTPSLARCWEPSCGKVRSYPVGFVTELVMHPMDFEEFCWAVGVSREGLETVRTSCRALQPVPDYLHDALLSYFRTYVVVGGMPGAIQEFADKRGDLAAGSSPSRRAGGKLPSRHQEVRGCAGAECRVHLR